MHKEPYLSIIIPAYNEGSKRIVKHLLSIDKFLEKKDFTYEIIVISDGSTDNTVELATSLEKLVDNLKIIASEKNMGKGYVVRQAMLEARGKYRLFTDADGATPIEEVDKLLPFLGSGEYDVAIGSIGTRGHKLAKRQPIYRVILGKLSNILVQIFAVPGIWDTQRGFKLFTAHAAEKIFPKQRIFRWGFDIEILALARKMGFKIKEVGIRWKDMGYSRVKLSGYFKTLWELLIIRKNLWTNKYNL